MEQNFRVVILILALIVTPTLAVFTGSLILNTFQITSTGKINAVGVAIYSDSTATQPLTAISWGTIYPGTSTVKHAYIVSMGNVPTNMSLAIWKTSPANAAQYLVCTWNYTGQMLQPLQKIHLAFTLAVSNQIIDVTDFSFTMNITAKG